MRAYRYRGRRDQQLYLAYSVETDRDWILPSNYRFLHWLLYLETDSDIVTFELRDDSITSKDDVSDWGRIHAWATTRDHCIVGHQIDSDEQAKAVKSESSVLALRKDGREVRPILESELIFISGLCIEFRRKTAARRAVREPYRERHSRLRRRSPPNYSSRVKPQTALGIVHLAAS